MSGSGSIVLDALDLRHQLEEEAQLADFHRLFHDVHAVEVVDDDGLEDEVAAVGVLGDALQHLAEVARTSPGRCFSPERVQVVHERLHAVQAGLVERLQDVERGKQERARAAGRVEDRDSLDGLPEGAQQLRPFAALRSRPGRTGGCPGCR